MGCSQNHCAVSGGCKNSSIVNCYLGQGLKSSLSYCWPMNMSRDELPWLNFLSYHYIGGDYAPSVLRFKVLIATPMYPL